MSRQRAVISGAAFVFLCLASSQAWAQDGRCGGDRAAVGHLKSLELSQQQIQQVSKLQTDSRIKTAPVRAQLEVRKAELRALWLASTPSRAAIVAKHAEIEALHRQLRDARIDLRLGVLGVLTPQQRTRFQAEIASGRRFHKGLAKRSGRGKAQGPAKAGPRQ